MFSSSWRELAHRSVLAALPLFASACSSEDPTGIELEDVRIEAFGSIFSITNGRSMPIYFDVVGPDVPTDWVACGSPDTCPAPIEPGGRLDSQAEIVSGPGPYRFVLLWWHFVPSGQAGLRIDRVRRMPFELS
jgi:hypothetical protein